MIHGSHVRSLAIALVLALVLVIACRQISLSGGYALHPGYRAQVDALLSGRLALTSAPDGLIHDLAWTETGVQQVWGLGVPLWQVPFELVGRIVGVTPFPDRAALVGWLTLMLFAVIRAFRPRDIGEIRPDEQRSDGGRTRAIDSRAMQIGAVLVTALLPAVVTMLRGKLGIYEEAALYAYGAAMILLAGTVALIRTPTTPRYLLLLGFAGLTGLIRPTVWFYGLAAALIASAILLRQRGRPAVRALALGLALFVAGGGALYATNALRFGSGTEFGHRLNLHSLPGNIVATRFSYPFERAGTLEAAQELVGSLFDSPERRSKRGFYQIGLHRWQSDVPRWREYYFTTFSWPYLPVIAAGVLLALLAWRRRGDPFARTVGAWALLGGAPLFAFYLHSPSVSSRYQLDLAPAIAALLLIAWRAAVARWPRPALAALVALWATAIATSKVNRPTRFSDPIGPNAAERTTHELSRAIAFDQPLPGAYDLDDPLLPIWLDAGDAFMRCTSALGAPIPCDALAMPGDVIHRGQRLGQRWLVDRHAIPDEPPPLLCRALGDAGDDTSPSCRLATVGGDPTAVQQRTFASPPLLYLNGFGWDLATGRVPPATLFYVDDADHIALDVSGPAGTDWERAVRVAIGLDHLRLVAVADTPRGARLRFAGGRHHRHPGLQVAFIAFGPDRDLHRAQSAFRLRSIRWRD